MGHYDQLTRQVVSDWHPLVLPYPLLLINSAVLVCSSITLELARRQCERQAEFLNIGILPVNSRFDPPWLAIHGIAWIRVFRRADTGVEVLEVEWNIPSL